MEQSPRIHERYTVELVIFAGYIIFFCIATIFYFAYIISLINETQQTSTQINVFATNLPARTPTPHISSVEQFEAIPIFEDDFSNDKNRWSLDRDIFREEVADGRLLFESLLEGNYAFTGCKSCPYLNEPFYLQADFATTKATDKSFGIIFNLNYSSGTFYLFQINTEARKYYFYHRGKDGWSLRAAGESNHINSFPAVYTLGIYANLDVVEFYINGKIIDSYKQSRFSFHTGDFSFYVDNWGFKLIVDNLRIYKAGK